MILDLCLKLTHNSCHAPRMLLTYVPKSVCFFSLSDISCGAFWDLLLPGLHNVDGEGCINFCNYRKSLTLSHTHTQPSYSLSFSPSTPTLMGTAAQSVLCLIRTVDVSLTHTARTELPCLISRFICRLTCVCRCHTGMLRPPPLTLPGLTPSASVRPQMLAH